MTILLKILSGVHIKSTNCDPAKLIESFKIYFRNKQPFYPEELEMQKLRTDPYQKLPARHGFGGWSDPRDIQLCISFFY